LFPHPSSFPHQSSGLVWMARMGRERLEIEFGEYSQWLADAIQATGVTPVHGACRGTANPYLFERLARALDARPGTRVLDLGCGIGGPGAWLAGRGCEVVGVDVMEAGVRGLRQLFPDSLALVARLRELPFADDSFEAAWALGVIETVLDKAGALKEVERVLGPRGHFAVYSFVTSSPVTIDAPMADRFEPAESMRDELVGAGFEVMAAGPANDLPSAPEQWAESVKRVRDEVTRAHGGDERLATVEAERGKIRRLMTRREIQPWMFVARKAETPMREGGGT
jgi:SAM-dependent methyltransferase